MSVLAFYLLACDPEVRSPASIELPSQSEPGERPKDDKSLTPAPLPKGVRLDPSYFYSSHSGQSVTQIALDVITTLKNAGTNTVFLYAYNANYGAYYPTTYSNTTVEAGYGVLNIFGAVLAEAKKQGLRVVAVVPLNNFKRVWENNPSWRAKTSGNVDYKPLPDTFLLSASVTEYQNWYKGFISDLIANNPTLDVVEAVEPTLDYFWDKLPDQNITALQKFNAQYPGSLVGSVNWTNFRAQEFLNLISIFNQQVHFNGKESALVHTWTVNSSGSLIADSSIKSSTGFSFVDVSKLTEQSKTDYLIVEFIWQQWFSEYGTSVFNSQWIAQVGAEYQNTLKAAGAVSNLMVHVEISTFTGSYNTTVPTNLEFKNTIENAMTLNVGLSVYDYNQIRTKNAFNELSRWR